MNKIKDNLLVLIKTYPRTYSQRLLTLQYKELYQEILNKTLFLNQLYNGKLTLGTRCWYLLHEINSESLLIQCKHCGKRIVKQHIITDIDQGSCFCNRHCKQLFNNQSKKIKRENFLKSKTKSDICYWLAKGYSLQDAIFQSRCNKIGYKEYWIAKGYSEEEAKQKVNNIKNPVKAEYWIAKGYSNNDEIQTLIKNEIINRKIKSKKNKEYWIAKGYSEEEAQQKAYMYWTTHNPTHVNYWIAKGYSEEDAKKKVFQKRNNHKEYWIAKGYSEEEAQQKASYNAKLQCATSIEYWIAKGYSEEEAKQKANEKCIGLRIAQNNFTKAQNHLCLEYWMAKGYSEEEAKKKKAKEANKEQTKNISHEKHVQARKLACEHMTQETYNNMRLKCSQKLKAKNKTHSPIFKEYWMAKGYSEEEAKKQVSITKCSSLNSLSRASKIEIRFFNELIDFLLIKTIISTKDQIKLQKWVHINDHNYCQDGRYNNIVIEFNGTNFHMDPRFYNDKDINPRGVSFKEVKRQDANKIKAYSQKQYNIIVVWEYDYLNHKNEVFSYIAESIKNEKNIKKGSCWDSASIFNKC